MISYLLNPVGSERMKDFVFVVDISKSGGVACPKR